MNGMGRPKSADPTVVVRLRQSVRDELLRRAERKGLTLSDYLAAALETSKQSSEPRGVTPNFKGAKK